MGNEEGQPNCGSSLGSHTPGPWGIAVWAKHHKLAGEASSVHQEGPNSDNLEDICDMDPWTEPAERMANARLIAASPDLLKLAEAFVREWEATWVEPDCVSHEWKYLYDQAKEVIRKAKGGHLGV